jgi:ADP-dependent NAD(P)H-hydrate dehydratase
MKVTLLTADELKRHPLPQVRDGDKYSHGALLVIAGSRTTPGSAAITATAAMRAGCGKITIVTVEPLAPHIALAVPEVRVLGLDMGRDGGLAHSALKEIEDCLGDFDAVVAGPGMYPGKVVEALAAVLLGACLPRLVLDAAMLHALAPLDREARDAAMPILLPHDREMASLIGCDPDDVAADPLACGRQCAARFGALTLVKGPDSHVVAPDGRAWHFEGGSPGLGVAGSGDALAGILGGLLARGAEPLSALLWAVWLHGKAGEELARKVGVQGFLAREISGEVPALLAEDQPSLE